MIIETPPQATSLRDRQRLRRSDSILDAAGIEFAQRGFSEARMEAIAARAEVAPATVYNYFGDKAGLLLALFDRFILRSEDTRREDLQHLPIDPNEAICAYLDLLFDREGAELVVGLGPWHSSYPALWREVYAASYSEGSVSRAVGSIAAHQDATIAHEVTQIFLRPTTAARLPRDLAASDLAEIVLAIGNLHWMRFLTGLIHDHADCLQETKRQVRLCLRGLLLPSLPDIPESSKTLQAKENSR